MIEQALEDNYTLEEITIDGKSRPEINLIITQNRDAYNLCTKKRPEKTKNKETEREEQSERNTQEKDRADLEEEGKKNFLS